MKILSNFIIKFVIIYFILSLPMMLGFGVVIDFIPGVSWFTIFKAYFITGIIDNYFYKILISVILTIILKVKRYNS